MQLFDNDDRVPSRFLFVKTNGFYPTGSIWPVWLGWKSGSQAPDNWDQMDDIEKSQWQSQADSLECVLARSLFSTISLAEPSYVIGEIADRTFIDWYFAALIDYSRLGSDHLPPEPGMIFPRSK